MSETALALNSDSALARAKTGASFIPSNIPEHLLAPPEEDDFHGVEVRTPLVSFNGKYGTFPGPGEEKSEGPKEISGIALARLQTAVQFKPTDPAKVEAFRQIGFDTLLQGDHKYICHAPDTRQPATLNPALTDGQRLEAKRLGIHGAAGKKCVGCPMSQFSTVVDGRPCKKGAAMLWLDAQRGEPVVFQVIAYKSVRALEDFLASAFANGKVSLYGYVLTLGRKVVNDKGNEYFELTAKLGAPIAAEEREVYRGLRAELYPLLVRTTEEAVQDGDTEETGPVPYVAAEGGGRVLDVDGPAEGGSWDAGMEAPF